MSGNSDPKAKVSLCESLVSSWLPITLCIGNTATERGSGFIQRTPKWYRIKGAFTPRYVGTEYVNGNGMKPKVKECTLIFLLSQTGSISSTLPGHI